MSYEAVILADSVNSDGPRAVRIVTAMLTFPRFLLAELNTHRVFSRNSASSRAIPTEKLIERVSTDPFLPATFNKRVKGMGIGEEANADVQDASRKDWLSAADEAAFYAGKLTERGLDKSRANRLLEPFMWHTAIVTSTEWTNFFALRCPPGDAPDKDFPAQWEFQQIAIMLREAMRDSTPTLLRENEWHRPLVDVNEDGDEIVRQFMHEEDDFYTERLNMLATRRLAAVSFLRHLDTEDLIVALDKAGKLVNSGHFSPTEHVARPINVSDIMDEKRSEKLMAPVSLIRRYANGEDPATVGTTTDQIWCGNLRGYWQYRKEFAYEEDHSKLLDYEVM